jgi:trans-2-enoyl-CoA reductase
MTLVMRRATCVADNGTEFTFDYVERNRTVDVYIDGGLHMTIVDVNPEDSIKEMNSFMDSWNQANPRKI